jgi:hypothetical protein
MTTSIPSTMTTAIPSTSWFLFKYYMDWRNNPKAPMQRLTYRCNRFIEYTWNTYVIICIIKVVCVSVYNSSTAQGGGGSFKNRKPIGEIGCCESGMAERSHWWTERCLISLSLSFFSFSLFLSVYLAFSDYLPTYLLIYLSIYLFISLSIYLPMYLSSCLVF